jgi:hypothetical protein
MDGWRRLVEDDPSTFPQTDDYILLHFENFSGVIVGRCEGNEEEGFLFYLGDEIEPCVNELLFVNGWMPIPKFEVEE